MTHLSDAYSTREHIVNQDKLPIPRLHGDSQLPRDNRMKQKLSNTETQTQNQHKQTLKPKSFKCFVYLEVNLLLTTNSSVPADDFLTRPLQIPHIPQISGPLWAT